MSISLQHNVAGPSSNIPQPGSSRIPQPSSVSRSIPKGSASYLPKPVKHSPKNGKSKLNRIQQKGEPRTVSYSRPSHVQSIPKSSSNGCLIGALNSAPCASKLATNVPEFALHMIAAGQAIDDETVSLVGSTDCLATVAAAAPAAEEALLLPAGVDRTVLLRRDNTFDVLDNKRPVFEGDCETAVKHPRPNHLTLDCNDGGRHSFDLSPIQNPLVGIRVNRKALVASTPTVAVSAKADSAVRRSETFSVAQTVPADLTHNIMDRNDHHCDHSLNMQPGSDEARGPQKVTEAVVVVNAAAADPSKANRFSFSNFPDEALSCSIDLVESSLLLPSPTRTESNSYEVEDSLGILTPNQMKEFCDTSTLSTTNNNRHSLDLLLNNLKVLKGTTSVSAAAALAIGLPGSNKNVMLRIEQTPSPEELPLDPPPVGQLMMQQQHCLQHEERDKKLDFEKSDYSEMTTTTKTTTTTTESSKMGSAAGKGLSTSSAKMTVMVSSNNESVITSVTSITSLDTGYQGDGEMSRPASRNGGGSGSGGVDCYKGSPVKRAIAPTSVVPQVIDGGPFQEEEQQVEQAPPFVRRPDPLTDSDFFTESDADDIFHRGDRRAQIIDGQLFGPKLIHNVYVGPSAGEGPEGGQMAGVMSSSSAQNSVEHSCMESSGIFTDDADHNNYKNNNNNNKANLINFNNEDISNNANASHNNSKDEPMMFDMSPDERSSQSLTVQSEPEAEEKEEENSQRMSHRKGSVNDKAHQKHAVPEIRKAKPMETSPQSSSSVSSNGGSPATVVSTTAKESDSVTPATKSATKRTIPKSGRSTSSSPPISKKKMIEQENKPQQHVMARGPPKKMPNKWDAVMSKIAQHQVQPKNYNEVKSRVNCATRNGGGGSHQSHSDAENVRNHSAGSITTTPPSTKRAPKKENSGGGPAVAASTAAAVSAQKR